MKKQTFLHLLQKKESIRKADLEKIQGLEARYPYSQMIHTLSAIGSRKLKSSESNKILTNAAVYATDRNVLKNLILRIDDPEVEVVTKKSGKKKSGKVVEIQLPADDEKTKEVKDIVVTKDKPDSKIDLPVIQRATIKSPAKTLIQPSKPIVHTSIDHPGLLSEKEADQLRADLMKNLEELLEIKKDFFGDKPTTKKSATKKTAATANIPVAKKSVKSPKIATKTVPKTTESTKKMRVTKSAKKPTSVTKTNISTVAEPKVSKTNSKLNSQQEIIDKFIKADPKIRRKKEVQKDDSNNDLAKDSVSFNDDLVSENLAKVMVKQGKTSKAIDIYKKLIWKFPQKKAYFASQIESLKEK